MLDGVYPKIMGVLNVTPDSFSDGGKFNGYDAALRQASQMLSEGVDIIDIGGESTRPNATPVTPDEEMSRVLPIIRGITEHLGLPISIDTYHPETLAAALEAGAGFINDITALQNPQMMAIAAQAQCPVCLMHMQGSPQNMQNQPFYHDVIEEVLDFFQAQIEACEAAGIAKENICLDPGFGFGKNISHNLRLLANLSAINRFNLPLVIGLSRKSLFGQLLDKAVSERLIGSITGAVLAAQQSRIIIRTHDVAPTRDAVKVIQAVQSHVRAPALKESLEPCL